MQQPSSRLSIDTSHWGKGFWESIHFASCDYPEHPDEKEKVAFKSFFSSLQYVLPCENCREHYTTYWNEHPIDNFLETGQRLREWTLQLHNHVNKRLGKREWSLAEFNTKYDLGGEDDEEEEPKPLSLLKQIPVPARPASVPTVRQQRFVHVGNGTRRAGVVPPKRKCTNCNKRRT